MLLLSLLIWYTRRTEPLSIGDLRRCLAVVLITLFLVPGDTIGTSCQAKQPEPPTEQTLLREGTRIPPTTGRIVMVGRRWAFIPIVDREEPDTVASRRSSVTHAFMISKSRRRATRLGSSGNDYGLNRFTSVASPMYEIADKLPAAFEQITLQENLMLQRIVKSIRADATDDHWVISGEITEFFNENRLSIRLAQRANRH
jgi:hypothetical protein